jgi:Ring finger domain
MAEYWRLGALMRLRNFLREGRVIDVDDGEFDFGEPLITVLNRPIGVAPGPIRTTPQRRAAFTSSQIYARPLLQRQFSFIEPQHNPFQHALNLIVMGILIIAHEEEQRPSHFLPKEATYETHTFPLKPTTATLEWECSICKDGEAEQLALHPSSCHSFHERCIQEWLWRSPSCPMCRSSVNPLTAVPK